MRRADAAGGEQIIVAGAQRVDRLDDRAPRHRARRAPRARRMPCTLSQLATCAIFLSCVRPDRISSPMTTSAAVQMRRVSCCVMPPVASQSRARDAISHRMTDYVPLPPTRPWPRRHDQAAWARGVRGHAHGRAARRRHPRRAGPDGRAGRHDRASSTTSSATRSLAGGGVPATLGYRGYTHRAASRSTTSCATASRRTRR